MYTTMSKIPFISLLFSLITLHVATAADPLYSICFSPENYTSYSPYRNNLNNLLNSLSITAPPTGFALGSTGQAPDRVNGLALCRGDVTSPNCKTCIIDATKEILSRCPNQKGAIIWYDYCLLKYSNVNFFGQIDNKNKFYLLNVNDVEGDPEEFYRNVKTLLTGVASKAAASKKLYATGEAEIKIKPKKLYGLAQCTRDLSSADCKKCLDDAISELPGCCFGKRGGRTVGGSCNVRYELYPIIDP